MLKSLFTGSGLKREFKTPLNCFVVNANFQERDNWPFNLSNLSDLRPNWIPIGIQLDDALKSKSAKLALNCAI